MISRRHRCSLIHAPLSTLACAILIRVRHQVDAIRLSPWYRAITHGVSFLPPRREQRRVVLVGMHGESCYGKSSCTSRLGRLFGVFPGRGLVFCVIQVLVLDFCAIRLSSSCGGPEDVLHGSSMCSKRAGQRSGSTRQTGTLFASYVHHRLAIKLPGGMAADLELETTTIHDSHGGPDDAKDDDTPPLLHGQRQEARSDNSKQHTGVVQGVVPRDWP